MLKRKSDLNPDQVKFVRNLKIVSWDDLLILFAFRHIQSLEFLNHFRQSDCIIAHCITNKNK